MCRMRGVMAAVMCKVVEDELPFCPVYDLPLWGINSLGYGEIRPGEAMGQRDRSGW